MKRKLQLKINGVGNVLLAKQANSSCAYYVIINLLRSQNVKYFIFVDYNNCNYFLLVCKSFFDALIVKKKKILEILAE